MLGVPNPWVLLAAALVVAGACAGSAKLGYNYSQGKQAREEVLIQRVADKTQQVAAEAISQIQPRYTTIQQKTETITREVPVYRDCRNTPDVLRLLNDALSNTDAADSVGSGELPKVDAVK